MNKILLLALTVACASPYQPKGFRGGYSEIRLASDMYEVTFKGNGYTSPEVVHQYLLRRAAELTRQNGFTHYVPMKGRDTSDVGIYKNASTGYQSFVKHGEAMTIKMVNNPPTSSPSYEAESILSSK